MKQESREGVSEIWWGLKKEGGVQGHIIGGVKKERGVSTRMGGNDMVRGSNKM